MWRILIYLLVAVFPWPAGLPAQEPKPPTEVIKANEDWRPISWQPARTVKGSALDFSVFLDAPAGKYGPVVVRDGKFAFANAPEKPVRIYGTVISHALPFLDKARCEQLADNLAACGYNGVRLHNYNFRKGVMKEIGSAEFTPEAQDQLDYFFFCLKQRGIYFTFPINAWGFFKAGDVSDVPEFRDRAFRFESNGLLPISADLQRWFKAYALNLLGRVNPYTGLALKDDPALLSVELTNENSLLAVLGQYPELVPIYRRKCAEDLQNKLKREPTAAEVEKALPPYVLSLQEEFFQTMKSFLRGAGVRQPLTDSNFRDNMVYSVPRAQFDYVDIHAYWALYKTLPGAKPGHEPAYRQSWINPFTVGWSYYLGPVAGRLFGKPYGNSEFNGCYPSPYWIYTGPVEAILAGQQEWNAVFRCGLGAHPEAVLAPSPVRQIGHGSSPLILLSERIGALLFAQGEVSPLPRKLPFALTREYLLSKVDLPGGPKYPQAYSQLAFQYQLGTLLIDSQTDLNAWPYLVIPPEMKIPEGLPANKFLPADARLAERLKDIFPAGAQSAPVLEVQPRPGSARYLTPLSETFLLPAESPEAVGTTVRISGNKTVSVCFAGSLDHRPLAESNRILALYLTDLKNTGAEIETLDEPKGNVVVHSPGKLPLLVHDGQVEVAFELEDRPLPHIWALKYDGSRGVEVQPRRTTEGFSFPARAVTDPETFSAFELSWN